MKINTRKAKDLSSKQKGTMFALMDKYYSNLDKKDHYSVYNLFDRPGSSVG